ncbi:hypothetical protein AB4Z34_36520, partial [Ensifer sp. 2YAB10]|uniref:hypothetical protein n=1 Tax=Ensifer sp. 2YAB10 TaxID=3233021 RepID=UPI003F8E758A
TQMAHQTNPNPLDATIRHHRELFIRGFGRNDGNASVRPFASIQGSQQNAQSGERTGRIRT